MKSARPLSPLRTAILSYIDSAPGYVSAQEVAMHTDIPYKAVIDALNALHPRGYVQRKGRKFSARWGSRQLAPKTQALDPLHFMASWGRAKP